MNAFIHLFLQPPDWIFCKKNGDQFIVFWVVVYAKYLVPLRKMHQTLNIMSNLLIVTLHNFRLYFNILVLVLDIFLHCEPGRTANDLIA